MFDPYNYSFRSSPLHSPKNVIASDDTKEVQEPNTDKPIVAIIGRPNVGKSSLFNRLTGESKSLITPIAGTTRDRVYGTLTWDGWDFIIVDTGGMLGDTDEWSSDIHDQATVAMSEADLIVVCFNIHEAVTHKDKELARIVRMSKKPTLLVVNKCDKSSMASPEKLAPFSRLGLGEPIAMSAIHALGEITFIEELTTKCIGLGFGPKKEDAPPPTDIKIAIVGKPNVGKSSFLNRILGQYRSVVSPIPGTTTDPVDEHLIWKHKGKEQSVTLIDTAGLRKKKSSS